MSHSRKHMTQGYQNNFPEPKPTEKIGKVTELRGSNQCEIEYPNGERVLVRFPSKFKKLLWIKRGNKNSITPPRSPHRRSREKKKNEKLTPPRF